jgi:hypothetical protein
VSTSIPLDVWGDDGWRKAIWETPGAGAQFRLGSASTTERMMEMTWRGAEVLSVERRPPEATQGGKVLHLHRPKRSTQAS